MRRILSLASSLIALLSFTSIAYADTSISSFDSSGIPFTDLGKLLSNVLALLFFFAGLLAFIFIIIGGIQWITAGGDAKAASAARDRITAAVVGLLVVVAAFAITLILNAVFGINLFNFRFPGAQNTAGT
jgi:hypothetical protein